jgi:hypothetical protein
MVRQTIRLPNGRQCALRTYVHAWRKLKSMSPTAQVGGFDHFPEDASRILREIRLGLHDRINRHVPDYGKGRKWHHDWQRAAIQAAIAVNTPRLVVRWVPIDLMPRLKHRLTVGEW